MEDTHRMGKEIPFGMVFASVPPPSFNQSAMKRLILFGLGATFCLALLTAAYAEIVYGDISWALGFTSQTESAPIHPLAADPKDHAPDAVDYVRDLFESDGFEDIKKTEIQLEGRISQVNRNGFFLGETGSQAEGLRGALDFFYYVDVRFEPAPSLLNQLKIGDLVVVRGMAKKTFQHRNQNGLVLVHSHVVSF